MVTLLALFATYGLQRTPNSGALLWRDGRTIAISIDASVPPAAQPVLTAGLRAWEAATTGPCGGVVFQIVAPAIGVGTIKIVGDTWRHDPGVASVTRLTFTDDADDDNDGKIDRADVELNAVDFELVLPGATATTGKPALDLQAVMTHEAGHILGLDHDCGTDQAAWPRDERGEAVASCSSSDAAVTRATMYFQIQPGDLDARTPAANDIAGACAALTHRGGDIDFVGGCRSVDASGLAPALAALLVARRRRSCHHDARDDAPAARDPALRGRGRAG